MNIITENPLYMTPHLYNELNKIKPFITEDPFAAECFSVGMILLSFIYDS